MKKTLKIFLISFTLSSFAIWAANELFFSVAPSKNDPVAIPKKNIALFFQKNDTVFHAIKTKEVNENRLAAIISASPKDKNDENELMLFGIGKSATKAISIASVEDVADIPLEYGAQPKKSTKTLPITKQISSSDIQPSEKVNSVANKAAGISEQKKAITLANTKSAAQENMPRPTTKTVKIADNKKPVSTLETDLIPLENGDISKNAGNIEIVNTAPKSQMAMADNNFVAVDTLAIEQKDIKEPQQKREWQPMSATDDNPWIVAQANKYAKNSKAVEDFAAKSDETDIENLLSPKKIEEEGKEVKTAEMVKNILIPIPEDILNDKNLTPQLVSSKKASSDPEFDRDDEDIEADSEEGSTLLKSITSIFSSSTSSNESSEEPAKENKKKNKKGLFAAFSNEKTVTKILPAEMKLAFQPGRAEISGQTLRWIQAFANKAAEDPSIVLEIRIDKNSSYALQQRRLDLLHTILSSRGMDDAKVHTVFTSREPNSFIIRTLRLSDNTRSKPVKTYQRKNANYQTW